MDILTPVTNIAIDVAMFEYVHRIWMCSKDAEPRLYNLAIELSDLTMKEKQEKFKKSIIHKPSTKLAKIAYMVVLIFVNSFSSIGYEHYFENEGDLLHDDQKLKKMTDSQIEIFSWIGNIKVALSTQITLTIMRSVIILLLFNALNNFRKAKILDVAV